MTLETNKFNQRGESPAQFKRAMKTKRMIEITVIKDHGRFHNQFCDTVLMLRKARWVGDREVVNNYVFSVLKRNAGSEFNFKEVEQ